MNDQVLIAGIPIQGAQAELARLIQKNIQYELALKQLRKIHRPYNNSSNKCSCIADHACRSLGILQALEDS